jgi:tRNA pseudouridine38-40 synthase
LQKISVNLKTRYLPGQYENDLPAFIDSFAFVLQAPMETFKRRKNMPNWKLTIEYEGTRYHGWQEQKNARTIYGEIRQAAENYFQSPAELGGAGRTDAGVHALGQVARLRVAKPASPTEVLYGLNDRLPADINILRVEEVANTFSARHDAITRFYLYQISKRRSAFGKKFVWWVKDNLDFEKMQKAADLLPGRHDFEAFCERREDDRSTIVVVKSVELKMDGDLILCRIGASHFLWKMVRRIVGTLAGVGRGKLSVEDFASLLQSRSNDKRTVFDVAANTAPPSGLFLEKVLYKATEKIDELRPAVPVIKL